MSAISVACNVAFGALASILAAEGEHVPAVTAPVRADIGDGLKAVGNAMIDLLRVVVL